MGLFFLLGFAKFTRSIMRKRESSRVLSFSFRVRQSLRIPNPMRGDQTKLYLKGEMTMAHWVIDDHGFGGMDYTCSNCGEVFTDLFYDMPGDCCPKCQTTINDDENEYCNGMLTNIPTVHLLTNEEAADIIENIITGITMPKRCGKTMAITLRKMEALCKAVNLLRNTPDDEVTEYVNCNSCR